MKGAGPRHAREVARLLRKLARLRLLAVLGLAGLLGLTLFLFNMPEPGAVWLGLLLGVLTMLALALAVPFLARTLRSLRKALHEPTLAAFHSPNSGYVFISAQGIFVERHLGFVPIRGARFEYGSRQLVLAVIRDNRHGEDTDYDPIDVPPGVSGEPLERFCASVNALPARAPVR